MILVTGASGNAGGAVVRALLADGQHVRALVRPGSEASLPAVVEPVIGDLTEPDTFAGALDSLRGAFLLSGYDGMEGLLARLRAVGVEQVVLLSGSSVSGGDLSNAVTRYQAESERLVRESGVPWTFLQPNSFMSNTLRWLPQLRAGDVIRLPFADVPIATIDPDDIGSVAAAAFDEPGHEGRVYRLSGPESLRPADQVAILGRVLGRELRFVAQTDDEARKEMSQAMPAKYVDAFFSFYVEGTLDESEVLPTVEDVTGSPPGTFEQWARAHAAAFS